MRGSHDWEHTLRVCRLCEHIGSAEGADMDVLLTAAYLHDIGRSFQDSSGGAVCHAQKGAKIARSIVKGLPLSDEQKENIILCIKSHRPLVWPERFSLPARRAPCFIILESI